METENFTQAYLFAYFLNTYIITTQHLQAFIYFSHMSTSCQQKNISIVSETNYF